MSQDGGMKWDDEALGRLSTALNESDVVGVRLDATHRHVDVLLHVLSLPGGGWTGEGPSQDPAADQARRAALPPAQGPGRRAARVPTGHRAGGPRGRRGVLPLAGVGRRHLWVALLRRAGAHERLARRAFPVRPRARPSASPHLLLVQRVRDGQGRHDGVVLPGGTIGFTDLLVLDAMETRSRSRRSSPTACGTGTPSSRRTSEWASRHSTRPSGRRSCGARGRAEPRRRWGRSDPVPASRRAGTDAPALVSDS